MSPFETSTTSAAPKRKPLNDSYAEQLNDNLQHSGGRSTAQDATLGREYDKALEAAEKSTDKAIRDFAGGLREDARNVFSRIHSDQPRPLTDGVY